MNCHYLSKQIVRSWRDPDNNLILYDIGKDSLEQVAYSDDLFAQEDLLTKSEEGFFNKKIENHLAHLSSNWETIVPDAESNLANALFMYFFLQTERVTRLSQRVLPDALRFSSRTTRDFKRSAQCMKEKYAIYANHLKSYSLFCSEVGFFSVPINYEDIAKQDSFAYAAAIRPDLYIMILPKGVDQAIAVRIEENIGVYSFGIPNALNRVIVPEMYVVENDIAKTKAIFKSFLQMNNIMLGSVGIKNAISEHWRPTTGST
jgi:hypothetical protein